MKSKRAYTPTKQHLSKAYKLYKRKMLYKEIIKKIGISQPMWTKHKETFYQYFRQQNERADLEGIRGRGKGRPRGQRKFTLDKRTQFLDCLKNDLTIETAARIVGIHRDTIYEWCKEYPDYKLQMDTVRDRGIKDVKNMLKGSAKGGFVMEVVTKEYLDKAGNLISKEVQRRKKHIKASVPAQQFILINRAGWTHDSDGKGTDRKGEILEKLDDMTDITDEEMEEFDK